MNAHGRIALLLALLLAVASCQPAEQSFLPDVEQVDLLIENGRIVDGSGAAPYDADLVIVGDKIVFLGDTAFDAADLESRVVRRIDARGRVVAPGFIDLHSHGDPLATPDFENFLAMGVTTITLGQDGSSPDVASLSDWLGRVADNGLGPNLAMLVGHGTLRNEAGIGHEQRPPPEALGRLSALLNDALDVTFGMSSGLEYNPGLNAKKSELLELARVVGQRDRIIMSHLRNEDDDQLEGAMAELLDQGQFARVHIAHLKSVYGKGRDRAAEILDVLASARANGVEITADMYPYTASFTGIGIVFPVWAKTQEQFALARTHRREELATYLRDRVMQRNGPEATLLGTEPYTGKTLADLSHELELPFEDVLIDVIGPAGASAAYFVMDEDLQSSLLSSPWVGVCSDGSPTGFHPRGHGTFAKIIEQYVVRDGLLDLQQAIAKMTTFAAGVLKLEGRGQLAAGMYADVIVFDPARVRARASYATPLTLADGFDVVIVNGIVARENGALSGARAGRVLAPGSQ